MNATDLWTGHEYAWYEYKQKGVFPLTARKVKVIKVTKRRKPGRENATTEVEVILPENGNVSRVVRARDIIDFWDEYVSERDRLEAERDERDRKYREESDRRYKERLELSVKYNEGAKLIREALVAKGISGGHVGATNTHIHISRPELIKWLQLPEGTL